MAVEQTVLEGKRSVAWLIVRLFFVDLMAMVILVGIWWWIRDLIKFCTIRLTITTSRVMGKTGLISTEELDSPLRQITGVKVSQGMFGKMCNYGTVSITTAGNVYNFDLISNPNKFKTVLMNQIEKAEDDKMERQAQKIASAIKK